MSGEWQKFDLGGAGLQAANLRLSRLLRKRAVAWGLLLLFPSGAHGWYLREPLTGTAFPALALATAAGFTGDWPYLLWPALGGLTLLLMRDILTLENRIVACNKKLRTSVYLSQGAAAPSGFRGRFSTSDNRDSEQPASRIPTFAEQEALLKEIAARKRENRGKSQ